MLGLTLPEILEMKSVDRRDEVYRPRVCFVTAKGRNALRDADHS